MNMNSIYLYGSTARGDAVSSSDTDILVVCESAKVFVLDKHYMSTLLTAEVNHEDISIYSFSRIKEMYEQGHLYAWHLYLESQFLAGDIDRLAMLGKPAVYDSYENDVNPLLAILRAIPEQLEVNKSNIIYEAGLAYVATRNIAMSSSYFSEVGLTFNAFSPFLISSTSNAFPLTIDQYSLLRSARLSGTRGSEPPVFQLEELLNWVAKLNEWAVNEQLSVLGGKYETKIYG